MMLLEVVMERYEFDKKEESRSYSWVGGRARSTVLSLVALTGVFLGLRSIDANKNNGLVDVIN